ncbi:sensor domain-containing protein [Rhodococcus sp. SGAir0479]|uniref:sensor domain-containing protein n=1 Tax=Rhodococcus sp. SGAir0479 TaxID=2567884 RepID=UPI0010CCECE5|nr:sensor domain-containing protein [Rhodococcus sp. SGAir0479]QCQ90809.1 sensor domain-containing protein [Rhodococcus sp. SGAir0479]
MPLRSRVTSALVLTAVLVGAGGAAAGCSGPVDGTARPVAEQLSDTRPLSELLLEPSAFPPQYPAVILPPQAVAQAAPDLTGVPPGARVEPAGCKPPPQDYGPDGTAMVVGTDNSNRSTITVELLRVDTPLAELGAQIDQCGTVTTTRDGVAAVVTTTLTPPPPIDADDTLALRRTVASGSGEQEVMQAMLTLVAQIDDVRVQATYMSFGADTAVDTETLDGLFTAAVLKVHGN